MANLSCKVEVSGLKIVNKVLKNMQEKICFTDDAAERNERRNEIRDYEQSFPECRSIRDAGTRIRNISGKFGGAAEVAGTNPTVGR